MGAPAILIEKLPSGQETRLALNALRRVLASGVCEGVEGGKASCGGVEVVDKTYSWIDGSQFTAYIATNETLQNVDMTNVPDVSPAHNSFFFFLYFAHQTTLAHMDTHTHTHTHVCKCTCMYTHSRTYTHTHTHRRDDSPQ